MDDFSLSSNKEGWLKTPWKEHVHKSREARLKVLKELEGHLERTPEHIASPVIERWRKGLDL